MELPCDSVFWLPSFLATPAATPLFWSAVEVKKDGGPGVVDQNVLIVSHRVAKANSLDSCLCSFCFQLFVRMTSYKKGNL